MICCFRWVPVGISDVETRIVMCILFMSEEPANADTSVKLFENVMNKLEIWYLMENKFVVEGQHIFNVTWDSNTGLLEDAKIVIL